jgi:outer membrane protein assembly factor BamB
VRRHEPASRLIIASLGRRCFCVVLLPLVFQTAASPVGCAQDRPGTFREAVSVDVETQVVKTLETAREHIVEGQWEPAVAILQELIDSSGDTLVSVEPGRYWNTADYCHLLISQFPATGVEAYRNRVDAQAKEWFESGQQALDETLLLRVVNSAFNSSVGDDALWLLGELAIERGQFALARQYWTLLVPSVDPKTSDVDEPDNAEKSVAKQLGYLTHPDPSASREEVLARLVLCSIFEGDRSRAQSELEVCRAQFPDSTGTLAGQTGKLADILAEVLRESDQWNDSEPVTGVSVAPGGGSNRGGHPKSTPRTDRLIWRRTLPRNRFEGPSSRTALAAELPPPYFPLADDGSVFVCGPDSVFAFDLATGLPKWPTDENDEGRIFTNILERPVTPHLPSAGLAWYALCVSEGRLYARMGPPVMRRSRNEGNTFSEIVGLDVAQREGELVFHVTSDVLDPKAESAEATSWSFEGTPLVSDGRVYVSARRGFPEDETIVACFDAESSRLLWRRRVCASLKSASDRFNLIGQNLLTLGDGRLFLTTSTGAIAALDAENGRLLWVVTYQSNDSETANELSDPRRHGLAPCLFHRGVVYAAPDDSNLLLALDATTGQPVWRQPFPDRVLQIVGVVDNRLILCGQSVWAVDSGTGQPAWPERVGFADPAGRGYGRPALSHDFLYWPTHDEILRIDHRTGRLSGRILLREDFGLSGGNLVIADGKLLIAQPNALIALGSVGNDSESRTEPASKPRPRSQSLPGTARRVSKNNFFVQASDDTRPLSKKGREVPSPPKPTGISDRTLRSGERARVRGTAKRTVQLPLTHSPARPVNSEVFAFQRGRGDFRGRTNFVQTSQVSTSVVDVAEEVASSDASNETTNQQLWPVRRAWQVTLPDKANLWFPRVASKTVSVGPVVTNAGQLQMLDPADGQKRWSINISTPFDQVVSTGNTLVLASSSTIVARSLLDGSLLWRRFLRTDKTGRIDFLSGNTPRQFLVITESQILALNSETGDTIWSWPDAARSRSASKPATARFPAEWTFTRKHILFRPAGVASYVLVNRVDGRVLRRGPLPFAASSLLELTSPHSPSGVAILGVDSQHRVQLTRLAELGGHWEHKPSGHSQGPPAILSDGQIVIVIDDRQFATRLDIETGHALWRRPLGATPLPNVERVTTLESGQLFAASDQVVHAFSLEDGSQNWQKYLGPGPWQIRHVSDALICIQTEPAEKLPGKASHGSSIAILDATNGRTLQRLNFETELRDSGVDIRDGHCLVRSGNQLIGFEPWPAINYR